MASNRVSHSHQIPPPPERRRAFPPLGVRDRELAPERALPLPTLPPPLPRGRPQPPQTNLPARLRSDFTDQLPQWGQAMAARLAGNQQATGKAEIIAHPAHMRRASSTERSSRVLVSPLISSPAARERRMRRMILPLRVLGRESVN